ARDLPRAGHGSARGAGVRDLCAGHLPRDRGLEGGREGVRGKARAGVHRTVRRRSMFVAIRSAALPALALSVLSGFAGGQWAGAQAYPAKPVKLIVGFPPGGGSDALARLVGAALTEKFGQQIVVDNKPGANTIIGTQYVQSQPADGYTLLF